MIAAGGSGTKPAGKGVDMDAVGNINGVPVYECDLDSVDKPWRKPGMVCCVFSMKCLSCLCYKHDVCLSVCNVGGLSSHSATKSGSRHITG